MKQFFPKLIMTVTMLLPCLQSSAYDFAADGVFFNITDATNHEVEVTYKAHGEEAYWGYVNIPSTVTNEGTTYLVTSIGEDAFSWCMYMTSIVIPNSVTSIGKYAFFYCVGLTSMSIPSSVTVIEAGAFACCFNIRSVYCHWGDPIKCNGSFQSSCHEEGTLYVPKGCADKYKSTYPWSKFWHIEEADYLGVEDIVANQPTASYIVYDITGVLLLKTEDMDEVKRLPAGLYIVNGKKALIR